MSLVDCEVNSGLRRIATVLLLSGCTLPGDKAPAPALTSEMGISALRSVSTPALASTLQAPNSRAHLTAQQSCLGWGYRGALPIEHGAARCAVRRPAAGNNALDGRATCSRYEELLRFQCLR